MAYSEALEEHVSFTRMMFSISAKRGTPFSSEIAQAIRRAETYYVDRDVQGLIAGAARTLGAPVLRDDMLPCLSGYVRLDRPQTLRCGDSIIGSFREVFWTDATLEDPGSGMHGKPGVLILVPGRSSTGGLERRSLPLLWPYGEVAGRLMEYSDDGGEGLPDDAGQIGATIAAWFLSFSLFLQQRILVASHRQAERHTRRRVEREGWQQTPMVRVVELRRKERLGEKQPVEPVEREWSCQWVVRGHWRQQFYPSKHQTQPIWITPYVKGPEDKPLKPPRATVFAVVR